MVKGPRFICVGTVFLSLCVGLVGFSRVSVRADQGSKPRSVLVTVLDQDGMPIRDLKASEFLVREDNQDAGSDGRGARDRPVVRRAAGGHDEVADGDHVSDAGRAWEPLGVREDRDRPRIRARRSR